MFNLNDADFVQVWDVIRRKNKILFLVWYGCFNWGLPVFLLTLIISTSLWDDEPITSSRLAIDAFVFSLMGLVWAQIIYKSNESRYHRLTAEGSGSEKG